MGSAAQALVVVLGWIQLAVAGAGGISVDYHSAASATAAQGRGLLGVRVQEAVKDGDIEGWLEKVVFDVDDAPIDVGNGLTLQVKDAKCHKLRIGTALPPGGIGKRRTDGGMSSSSQGQKLHADLTKVMIDCDFWLHYSKALWPGHIGGVAEGTLSATDGMLSFDAELSSSDPPGTKDPIPDNLVFTNCKAEPHLKLKINKGGTAWTKFVELVPGLHSLIEQKVDAAIASFVNDQCLKFLQGQAGKAFNEAAGLARELIAVPKPERPAENASWVKWETIPLVDWLVRAQHEVLNTRMFLDKLLRARWPGGDACIVGSESTSSTPLECVLPPKCILGGNNDTECTIRHSLRDPAVAPANLRVKMLDGRLEPHNMEMNLVVPQGTMWESNATADNLSARTTLGVSFAGIVGGAELADCELQLSLNVEMTGLHGAMLAQLGVDNWAFSKVPDFLRIYPACLAPTVRHLEMVDMDVFFTLKSWNISLLRNTKAESPLVAEAATLLENLVSILRQFDPTWVALLQGYIRKHATPFLSTSLQEWAQAEKTNAECPAPMGQETGTGFFGGKLINPDLAHVFASFATVSVSLAALLIGLRSAASHLRAPPSEDDAGTSAAPGPDRPNDQGWEACARTIREGLGTAAKHASAPVPATSYNALCTSHGRSVAAAVGLPLMVAFCVLSFAASNVMVFGATSVNMEQGKGSWFDPLITVEMYQMMVYSVLYSIHRLWSLPALASLGWVLFGASFVLPYLKLFLLLVCWVAPTSYLPPRARGIMLAVLDEVGKVALVDIYVMQFISTTLFARVFLSEPGVRPLAATLRTNQELGFTIFVGATVTSLVLGHFVLHCHHEEVDEHSTPPANSDPSAGISMTIGESFSSGMSRRTRSMTRRTSGNQRRPRSCLGVALAVMVVLVVLGTLLPAFSVKLSTPFGHYGPYSHSFWGVGLGLPSLSENPSGFQATFGQMVYLFFTIGVIYAHLLWLPCLWLFPPLARRFTWVVGFVRSTFPWAALDVALVSMMLTLIEMGESDLVWVAGTRLQQLERYVGRELPNNLLEIKIGFGVGTYLLLPAVVMHHWIGREVLAEVASRDAGNEATGEGTELGFCWGDWRGRSRSVAPDLG